jgi:hypothetical protein
MDLASRQCTCSPSVTETLATKQITVLEHPDYSPDLFPNDFYLFPKIKEILKRRHLEDVDDIRNNTTAGLKAIHKTIYKIVLKGGLGAGICALVPKGSTLKATTVVFRNKVCGNFTVMSLRTSSHFHCNNFAAKHL